MVHSSVQHGTLLFSFMWGRPCCVRNCFGSCCTRSLVFFHPSSWDVFHRFAIHQVPFPFRCRNARRSDLYARWTRPRCFLRSEDGIELAFEISNSAKNRSPFCAVFKALPFDLFRSSDIQQNLLLTLFKWKKFRSSRTNMTHPATCCHYDSWPKGITSENFLPHVHAQLL